jgi:hypothetical protein
MPVPPLGHVSISSPPTNLRSVPESNFGEGLRAPTFSLVAASRRTGQVVQCAEQELNLQSSKASGLQPPRLADAQPTHVVQVAREGVEPTNNHEGLNFAALPVCVPRHVSVPDGIRTHGLLRDRQASTPLLCEDEIICHSLFVISHGR